jgi:hypothetical protein
MRMMLKLLTKYIILMQYLRYVSNLFVTKEAFESASMKIKVKELKRLIREEFTPYSSGVMSNSTLKDGFQRLSNAFPTVVSNMIVDQNGGKGADNRTRQSIAATVREHVSDAAAQFEHELQSLIDKSVSSAVRTAKVGDVQTTFDDRPDTGPNADQRKTIAPPRF